MSETTNVTTESPAGEFKKPEAKRLAWHISIFTVAAILTPAIDLLVTSLTNGSFDLGKYNVIVLGGLNILGQFIRLMVSGAKPPEQVAP